jgi:predicted component of type VI protein secretion system
MADNPKLVMLSEPLRGQTFQLVNETYTIGRVESCSICIPDPTISSKHCTLSRQPAGNYLVTDHGSTNGTRVNGMRIEEQELANSDILQLGGVEMLFDFGGGKSSTGALGTQTGIDLTNSSGRTSVGDLPNFSPFGSKTSSGGSRNRTRLLLKVAIVILSLAVLAGVLGLLDVMFFHVFFK